MQTRLQIKDVRTEPQAFRPRYNIAPTQPVVTVAATASGEKRMGEMRWGLVPAWAKDLSIGNSMINARSETAAQKPAFRRLVPRRRCVILADGFFEWRPVPGQKNRQPYRITFPDADVFGFAGLWDRWHDPAGQAIHSCTILTTDAGGELAAIHPRMPVILDAARINDWLDPATEDAPGLLTAFAAPCPFELRIYPVSTLVNSPKNDLPEVIEPLTQAGI